MYEEIAKAIRLAEADGQKIAMFHYQVLIHADLLAGVNAESFCERVGMKSSFKVEFSKMIALAKVLKQEGVRLEQS